MKPEPWLTGVETTARGIKVTPLLPFDDWRWEGGLLEIGYAADSVRGGMSALAAEVIEIDLALPSQVREGQSSVEVEGSVVPFTQTDGRVRFRLPVGPGKRTTFRVEAIGA